jgi:vancomycin resistance protein YoaR
VLQKQLLKPFTFMLAVVFLQIVLLSAVSLYLSDMWSSQTEKAAVYHQDLSIAGIAIGGLDEQEAALLLRQKADQIMQSSIELVVEKKSFWIDAKKINLSYNLQQSLQEAKARSDKLSGISAIWANVMGEDLSSTISLYPTYDEAKLASMVADIAKQVNRPAIPVSAKVNGKMITIVPEVVGYEVEIEKTIAKIREELTNPTILKVPAILKQTQPELTAKQLEGLDTLLAEQITTVDTTVTKRLVNVQRAAELINNTFVLPDQMVSFNALAAPYRKENGYEPVPILEDEEIPDGVAGGATQVASSLYVTAVKSNLPIVERHNNRRPLGFLPEGHDAFVRDQEIDLRFMNRTGKAIYIYAQVTGNQLRVAIFGTKPTHGEIAIVSEKVETYPPETIVRKDMNMLPGDERIVRFGTEGMRVKVYTTWKEKDGKFVKKLLSDDYYKPLHHIIAIGPKREDDKVANENEAGGNEEPLDEDPAIGNTRPPDIPEMTDVSGESQSHETPANPSSPASGSSALTSSGRKVRIENGVIIIDK